MAKFIEKCLYVLDASRMAIKISKDRLIQTSFRFKVALTTAFVIFVLLTVTMAVFIHGGNSVSNDPSFFSLHLMENKIITTTISSKTVHGLLQQKYLDEGNNQDDADIDKENALLNSTSRKLDMLDPKESQKNVIKTFGENPTTKPRGEYWLMKNNHQKKNETIFEIVFVPTAKDFLCYIHFRRHKEFIFVLLGNYVDYFNITERFPVAFRDLKIDKSKLFKFHALIVSLLSFFWFTKEYFLEPKNCFWIENAHLSMIDHYPENLFDPPRWKRGESGPTLPALINAKPASRKPSTSNINSRQFHYSSTFSPSYTHPPPPSPDYFRKVICPKICAEMPENGGTICNCDSSPLYQERSPSQDLIVKS